MSNKEQMQELNNKLNQNMMELNSVVNVIAQLPPKQTPETLTITPTKNKQTSRGLYNVVTVDAIPDEYIIPNGTKEITENGTYDVKDFETATVNVPAPKINLGIKTITTNGDYNASDDGLDGYSSVEVNVTSSGGGSAEPLVEKDVNFYTPYGDLVASYTIEEANNLTELPEAPELPRLTFQEWNYDLADIQATTTPLDIGGTYTTTSGACEFDVDVNSQSGMTVTFSSLRNMTSVDWGDGTVDTNLTHTYTTAGKYTIITYGLTHLANYFLTGNSSTWNNNLVEVRLSTAIMIMTSEVFQKCQVLKYITVPNSVTINNSTSQFYYAYALEFYVFPKNSTAINASYMFAYCYNLKGISMPIGLTSFNTYVFQKCYSLKRVIFSKNAKSIYNYMLSDCFGLKKLVLGNITSMSNVFGNNYSLEEIDLTSCTSVPTLSNGSVLSSVNKTCKIKVPANLYESFKTASNWSTYKDYFVAI